MSHEGASAGATFTLRFPFQVAPGQEISGLDQPIERRLDGLTVRLERRAQYYLLKVEGFKTEDSAKAYLNRVWAGLMWALLSYGVAFTAELALGSVTYAADPEHAAANFSKSSASPSTARSTG